MTPPSLPPDVFDALAPAVQAYLRSLEARLAELEARLGQNSTNSSKPPSSDPPAVKRAPPRPASGKKPGGQPDHPRHERVRLSPTRVIDHRPRCCRCCRTPLGGDDPDPAWQPTWELPDIRPRVTEHRFHRLQCPACGQATAAPRPDDWPADAYGPALKAALTYLTGVLHLSKAQTQELCAELLGLPISTGPVCAIEAEAVAVLAAAVAELRQQLPSHDVNLDETGWKQSGQTCWLWAAVTAGFTVFHLAYSRGRKVVEELLGTAYPGVATTDRWSAYARLGRRQLCWAHLRRDFQALIDRGGFAGRIGEELLFWSELIFTNWKRIRDGTLLRATAVSRVQKWFAPEVRLVLRRGAAGRCAATRALCANLLRDWEWLWTFCAVEGVEPTNNAAERALRPAVLWRKRSQGTRSEAGSRYVATVLSVAATCRQLGKRVWGYLADAFAHAAAGRPAPSLLVAS